MNWSKVLETIKGQATELSQDLQFRRSAIGAFLSFFALGVASNKIYSDYWPSEKQPKTISPASKRDTGLNLYLPPAVLEQPKSPAHKAAANVMAATIVEIEPTFDKEDVLADYKNLVNDEFGVDPEMHGRVAFWFDIYTRFNEEQRVIHHSKYPWIVFKVVDVTPIIYADTPRRRWMRNEKADKYVKSQVESVRKALRSLANKKNFNRLNTEEELVLEALKKLPGKMQTRAREASTELRVQHGQKNQFEQGLKISPRYMKEMEDIFAAKGLPTELTRLPFVESSFNDFATSKVGASGIWQFVGWTGRKYMIINDDIDERRSPLKSTEAAARLLKENHLILGRSWPLAITAFNHGPSGVRRAAKTTGTKNISTIVNTYRTRNFNFATVNYYACFLAALYAEKYSLEIFGSLEPHPAPESDLFRLPRPMRTKNLLTLTGLSQDELVLHNPDLKYAVRKNAFLPRGFRLHVPPEAKRALEDKFVQADSVKASSSRRG